MTVKIELPAEIEAALRERWKDLPRAVLEAVAIEGYREGVLSHKQVGDLLGASSRWEVENFLAEHKVPRPYAPEDLNDDLKALSDVEEKRFTA